MSVIYRRLHPDEEDAVIDLWARTFVDPGQEPDSGRVRRQIGCDPGLYDHTVVAVEPEGAVLAAAHYWLNHLRDIDGTPLPFGCVSHVATRPEARRQGHATRLVELLIEDMVRAGCAGSILFASEVGKPVYARLGWRDIPTRYRQGPLSGRLPEVPVAYSIAAYDPTVGGWGDLAAVYDAYNAARPFTTVRDLAYWRGYAGLRYFQENTRLLVARRPGETAVRGYLRADLYTDSFVLTEIGALPGHSAAIPALVGHIARQALDRGGVQARAYLPGEPAIDSALEPVFERMEVGYHDALMARPLQPGWGDDRIPAIYSAPGAVAWAIDDF